MGLIIKIMCMWVIEYVMLYLGGEYQSVDNDVDLKLSYIIL